MDKPQDYEAHAIDCLAPMRSLSLSTQSSRVC
jgi:hypothetical protein